MLETPAGTIATAASRPLGFEDRVECQRAIEDVYWRHRIWPETNPQPKPPLGEVVSDDDLRRKVETTILASSALERFWEAPVGGAQLQAEIDRMARGTRQPEVLRELWAALGDDAGRVAECLARPLLVERLARRYYARDQHTHAGLQPRLADWLVSQRVELEAEPSSSSYRFSLPELTGAGPTSSSVTAESWIDTASVPEGVDGTSAVWTGSEMIVWGGSNLGKVASGAAYDPFTDTWRQLTTRGAPTARWQHTAVWTGSEMIVWGGCNLISGFCEEASGGRYDPATDRWRETAVGPLPRRHHATAWTGSRMVVWGGCNTTVGDNRCDLTLQDGGAYDPATDSWTSISTAGAPVARVRHTAVWTGSELVVWGGASSESNADPVFFDSGGRWNPNTDTWNDTASSGAPAPRRNHTAVWDGSKMLVWGGASRTNIFGSGGRYDPVADTWTTITTSGAPEARFGHSSVWTGTTMIVWGGVNGMLDELGTGGRYDPQGDSWSPTSTLNAPPPRAQHRAVWTGTEMIVWGEKEPAIARTGGRYRPDQDTWLPMNLEDPVEGRGDFPYVWTGSELIVWSGDTNFGELEASGDRYDPATDSWRPTSGINAPEIREHGATAVWTGTEMIVWGGQTGTTGFDTGGRYAPASDSWQPTTTDGAPAGRADHVAVWTGGEMIVWGGQTETTFHDDAGGRYDPVADQWTPTSAVGAPEGRYLGTAVWTGSRMLVWGGFGATGALASGRQYDPSGDVWTAIDSAGAPVARGLHSAVWTGTEMIVWGGLAGTLDQPTYFHSGGRYDPVTDGWQPTSVDGPPSARTHHGAAWTGSEMIVWGGCNDAHCGNVLGTGSRYDPIQDSWSPTTIGRAPSPRSKPAVVWTGSELLVWGGLTRYRYAVSGGRYRPGTGGPLPPEEVSRPGNPQALVFTDKATLIWEPADESRSTTFNVYRGDLASLTPNHYGTCFESGLTASTATDDSTPASGSGRFYLVTGKNGAGEGALGNASDGTPRPNESPCP